MLLLKSVFLVVICFHFSIFEPLETAKAFTGGGFNKL